MQLLDNIRVVLVEPMIGGNIGAVCRAINNNGITDLAVVNPRPDTDWNEAEKLACNARPQLAARKTFDTLEAAIAEGKAVLENAEADVEALKAPKEKIMNIMQSFAQDLYGQPGAEGAPGPEAAAAAWKPRRSGDPTWSA